MGGGQGVANATPRQQVASFLPPLGILLRFFIVAISLQLKEKSPEMSIELNLGVSDILESSIFSCTHIIQLIVMMHSMKYALRQCTK